MTKKELSAITKKELSAITNKGLSLNEGGFVCFPVKDGKRAIPCWTKPNGPMSRNHFLKSALTKDEVGDRVMTGIAIRLGDYTHPEPCCLIAYDFDEAEAAARWMEEHPGLAAILPISKTARGNHVIARSRILGLKSRKYSNGEFRANGNYIVIPPSKHNSGTTYAWQRNQLISLSSVPIVEDLVKAGLISSYEDLNPNSTRKSRVSVQKSPSLVHAAQQSTGLVHAVINKVIAVRQYCLGVVDDKSLIPQYRKFNRLLDKIETLQDAVSFALPDPSQNDGYKQNNHCLWILRRAFLALKQGMIERGLWNDDPEFEVYLEEGLFSLWFSFTKPFHTKDKRDYRLEYERCRINVKSALNAASVLETAAHFARITRPPRILDKYEDELFSQLGNLCRHLQLMNEEKPFFLGDKDAGHFIGKHSKTAWRWLMDLQDIRIIKLHRKGTQLKEGAAKPKKPLASEYFYIHDDLYEEIEMLEESAVEEVA